MVDRVVRRHGTTQCFGINVWSARMRKSKLCWQELWLTMVGYHGKTQFPFHSNSRRNRASRYRFQSKFQGWLRLKKPYTYASIPQPLVSLHPRMDDREEGGKARGTQFSSRCEVHRTWEIEPKWLCSAPLCLGSRLPLRLASFDGSTTVAWEDETVLRKAFDRGRKI
ncbi:hypothetical protein JAAARDRAFT_499255 [Jaapia argillacea MUCL 33604]|uniref:Uncharacterized protein n=1 Tax=Jaapia argillacea MUCL 33604 TaxID=933084 RepID=A0A067PL70_9AGAM|nr:hypothetical protein JAAARDRAFT_499255 [Jaapia argillacea MUCL 33604]